MTEVLEWNSALLTIGEAAAYIGRPKQESTLFHWESEGVLVPKQETEEGQRRYRKEDLDDFLLEYNQRKSPLRYPGGKTRAICHLVNFLPTPDKEKRICSPFIGGGSFELSLVERGHEVWGYDAFEPLVNFWQQALADAPSLAKLVQQKYPPAEFQKHEFYRMQRQVMGIRDTQLQAAMYFVINRSSYSGVTLAGGMSPGHERFNGNAIDRLRRFNPNKSPHDPKKGYIHVELADFHTSIPKHDTDFLYLDPPYVIDPPKLYGRDGDMHENFDHEGLADLLMRRDRWVLSYNECQKVRDLYPGCNFDSAEWRYGMSNGKASNEVIITPRVG